MSDHVAWRLRNAFWIATYIDDRPATAKEIARAEGLSISTVHRWLREMERWEMATRSEQRPATWTLTEHGREQLARVGWQPS